MLEHMVLKSHALPERYAHPEHQLVRGRSIKGILQYAELIRGKEYAEGLLENLGVHSTYFQKSDSFVNPLFGHDLLQQMNFDGFSDYQARQMGTMTLITNFYTPLGKLFREFESPYLLYKELYEKYTDRFDHMWSYKLTRLDFQRCTVEITPREHISDLFRVKQFGSRHMCLFRQGVCASLLGNIQRNFVKVVETRCMYDGDSRCVYEVSWN